MSNVPKVMIMDEREKPSSGLQTLALAVQVSSEVLPPEWPKLMPNHNSNPMFLTRFHKLL